MECSTDYYWKIIATDCWDSSTEGPIWNFTTVAPLVADADGPYEGVVGEPIQFYGSATGGVPPYSWNWEFGDGSHSTEQNPMHTYASPGTYTATLTVIDSFSPPNTDSNTTTVEISDITPPEISNIQDYPDPQEVNGWVNITCTVTDNIEVNEVKANITYPNDDVTNVPMINIAGTDDYYYNTTYSITGTYNYFIWASDTSGNENASATCTFTMQDTTLPEITDNTPTDAYTGCPFIFNATVIDNIEVANVYVYYWFGNGAATNESMIQVGSTDYYEYAITIPSDSTATLHYKISAVDDAGNWVQTGQKDVAVIDNNPPNISNVDADPYLQLPGRYVNITCNVTDNIGINEVYLNITYPTGNYENFSIAQNKIGDIYYCNRTYDEIGTYNYFIWANDTSGNEKISDDVHSFDITNITIPRITTLKKNWNLFSLPFNQSITLDQLRIVWNSTVYSWDEAIAEHIIYGVIYDWNRTEQRYNYYYDPTDSLHPGYGYWIICYKPECELGCNDSYNASGNYITTLKEDWNCFGLPFNYSVTLQYLCFIYDGTEYNWTEAVKQGIVYGVIYDWNRMEQRYNYLYQEDDVLKPGYGYWIISYVSECEMQYNPESAMGKVDWAPDNPPSPPKP
jgi:PKD repeat protein